MLAFLGVGAGCAPAERPADPEETHLGVAASPLKWGEPQSLQASGVLPNAHLGVDCAFSGDTAFVSGPYTGNYTTDAAHVFVQTQSGWKQQARLEPDSLPGAVHFGASIALSGDTALVGALADGDALITGSAYVFVRSAGTWSAGLELVPGDGEIGNGFGSEVALSGDLAFVGAPLHAVGQNAEQGAVHVFRRTGADWIEQPMITILDGEAGDHFGTALAAEGNTLVVGAEGNHNGGVMSGSAYVFVADGAGFTQQWKLTPTPGVGKIAFGHAVAISGDTVAVGAPDFSGFSFLGGVVYVSEREGGVWSEPLPIEADNPAMGDLLGRSVALSADLLVAGAPLADAEQKDDGAVYVFGRDNGGWPQRARLTVAGSNVNDHLGDGVAVWGHTILAGADSSDAHGKDSGAAYIFEPLRENGAPCAGGATCASNYCIDGVCCNVLCLEADMACSAATKGSGADGVCGPISGSGGQGGEGGGQTGSLPGQAGSGGGPGGTPGSGGSGAPPGDERSYYSCTTSPGPRSPGADLLGVALAVLLASRARRRRPTS